MSQEADRLIFQGLLQELYREPWTERRRDLWLKAAISAVELIASEQRLQLQPSIPEEELCP
jgi:hypothetical protein